MRPNFFLHGVFVSALLLTGTVAAQEAPESIEDASAQFLSSLEFREGEIEIGSGLATAKLDAAYRYLGPEDATRVLVDAWGNMPGSSALGMIFPAGSGPLDENGWAVVVQYEEDGYVSDDDAATLDYDALLSEMKKDTQQANAERIEAGYGTLELVGWAEPPSYDAASHKLYWAKELAFDDSESNVLNYNIRILGRRGVLVLNAVGDMTQLDDVRRGMRDVLARVDFNAGNRYADFDPSVDQVAAYGIGALVAGKLAGKVGLLAKLGILLAAGKKFIVFGVIALFALVRKIFSGRKGGSADA